MNEQHSGSRPASAEKLLGPRMAAGLLDFVVLALLGLVMTILFGETNTEDGIEVSLSGVPFVVYVLLSLGYYFGLEATSGQTLGKRLAGIKVVSLDGGPPSPGQVLVRTLLRFIDGFAFYLVAVLVIAVTPNDQRIGDLAARTTVVRVRQ